MIRRLNSNIAYALIASAVGLSAAGHANAADNPSSTTGSSTAATTPAMPSTNPAAAGASTTTPSTGTANDSTMAPRGANPSTAANATANGSADSPAKRIFDQLDTNHDGALSLEEFSRATFQQPAKQ